MSRCQALRTRTKVPGLWSTGTDSLFGGFCGALMAGVVTFLHLARFTHNALAVLAALLLAYCCTCALQVSTLGVLAAVCVQIGAVLAVLVGAALPVLGHGLLNKCVPAARRCTAAKSKGE